MPATNYTPIQFYRSTTSGNQPSAANLSPGELALNIADTDMTMYFENASGVVKRFFNNPAELKYPTADGTSGQGVKTDGSKTLSFGALASAAITNNTRQAVTSSATTTINLASGQVIDLTMAANITTLSFTNVPASGTPVLVQIVVKNASDGTAYTIAWPSSVYWSGQYTGTTITNVQTAPTLATGANGVTTIALLTTDGGTKWRGWVEGTIPGALQNSLYAWGKGSDGGLGIGINAYRSSPVQIGALTNWSKISSGQAFVSNFGVAIKTDGTLWSWGRNNQGNLGQNNTANLSSPVQIGSDTNWSQVSCGDYAVLAVKTNGTLWSWGSNNDGKLGLNQSSVVAKSSPTQIGSATDWYLVSAGTLASFAIKTNNTLWAWGSNGGGALGDGTSVDKSSPIQIGALTNWSRISAGNAVTFATKTDGTLWSWGAGFNGGLGLGNTTSYSSPKQIGALTTWATPIGGSQRYNGFAIKTDNTLWAWGINTNGQLGQNSTVSFSSPVQVGGAEWSVATSGIATTLAVKTNGTLWGWGLNSNGIIGDSSVVPKSSPVQVGALTTWSNVSSFYTATFAISTISINPG